MWTVVCAVAIVLTWAVPGAYADVRMYDLQVRIDATGAGEATLRLSLDHTTRVPLAFATVTGLSIIDGPTGVVATIEDGGAQLRVLVALPADAPVPASVTLRFQVPVVLPRPVTKPGERAKLPAGVFLLKHAFVNTEPETIARYAVAFVFPPALRAHAVREGEVLLGEIDGAPGARLEVLALVQGGTVGMQVELGPHARPWGWLLAGLVLSLLYLVSFRDLVARPSA
jgi:hypothetical protein